MACKNGSCSRKNKLGGGSNTPSVNNPALSNNGIGVQALQQPGFFKGSPGQFIQNSTLSPQQEGLQGNLIQSAFSQLQNINDPNSRYAGFEPIEQRARSQFFGNTIPTLAERFTSMGDSAQNSSAFQNSLGSAGADLEEGLAALRSQYGQQQQGNQLDILRTLLGGSLGQSRENSYIKGQPGFLENVFGSVLGAAPSIIGSYLSDRAALNASNAAAKAADTKKWEEWAKNRGGIY